jgi:hypothetical protein
MKRTIVFLLYFLLGFFLIFSYKKINQAITSQQLKTPLTQSAFSLDVAPAKSLRGTIISLFGEVSWQSRIATESSLITEAMQIQQGETIKTSETGRAVVIFFKIVNINIYPKTEINLIQTLLSNIVIEQNSGKSEYTKLDNYPLNIRSKNLLIKINQGGITVTMNEDQPYVLVDVKSGSITIGYNDSNYITRVLDIKSGNRLIFQTDTKKVGIVAI